jgi:uncharacterized OB-fold protein
MDKPLPVITPLTRPYWQAVEKGELALQRCTACHHWIHFPEPCCPACGGSALSFEAVSGAGEIESYSIIHRSFVAGFGPEPYAIAWVALPEQAGLRVMCNIVDCHLDHLSIGTRVNLCFETRPDFGKLPQFTPTRTGTTAT